MIMGRGCQGNDCWENDRDPLERHQEEQKNDLFVQVIDISVLG
ncbi:15492_t:CDS:2 [Cetraspora pellucida]|uniref:15492_t:CDS:1 n=1 Tax=Cetraspora pellucida TaxID=1433469 RepID=A0A9N9GIZ9_9GLOM|nr:15492_t:CDS:2 [Cetraspora pellucida]